MKNGCVRLRKKSVWFPIFHYQHDDNTQNLFLFYSIFKIILYLIFLIFQAKNIPKLSSQCVSVCVLLLLYIIIMIFCRFTYIFHSFFPLSLSFFLFHFTFYKKICILLEEFHFISIIFSRSKLQDEQEKNIADNKLKAPCRGRTACM